MPRDLGSARAIAHANIALAKYWGKSDVLHNLPAVPSISLTLAELTTETEVSFDADLERDELVLDGRVSTSSEMRRVVALLDRVRTEAGVQRHARVVSENRFPTAAGLASSASGFAALAAAAMEAARCESDPHAWSAMARRSSASAARSIYGGFVELPAGAPGEDDLYARPIAAADHWNVRLVIALTATGPKSVGSTEAMERSRRTSPFYESWVATAPRWCDAVRMAVVERDLDVLGEAMEQSTLAFHCCAITSLPSVLYWGPATLAALDTVRSLRSDGIGVWATMDAGPHVKALCETEHAPDVRAALLGTAGVLDVIVAAPGSGVEVFA